MLLGDPLFWSSLCLTAIYSPFSVVLAIAVTRIIAVLLHKHSGEQRLYHALEHLPRVPISIYSSRLSGVAQHCRTE